MLEGQEQYRVQLEIFEGPLDLLLYLIRKNELDIYDIPISLIVEQYQAYLDLMRSLNLEVAGEFLVMAATLSHIKSRMLLPRQEEEKEEDDPRKELVARLLEYQRYKEAANLLLNREQVGKDVFVREFVEDELRQMAGEVKAEKLEFEEVDIFHLLDSFQDLLKRISGEEVRVVLREQVRMVDRISYILEILREREVMEFGELFAGSRTRLELVVTFLALLELIRLQVVKAFQAGNFGPIQIRRAVAVDDDRMKLEHITSLVDREEKFGKGEGQGDN